MHRQLPLASSRVPKKLPVPRSKDANWVRQLAAGSSTAWVQLMEHWSPRLYTYLLYQGLSEPETQTLLQTIFAEVVQQVRGGLRVTSLTVLLFSVASQQVVNHYRQRTPDPLKPQLLAETIDEHQRLFLQTFLQFPLEARQVLLLYYLFEVTLPEIAQIVGKSEEALLKVLYRFKHYWP